jgi:microcystin-dependent protein
MSKADKTKLDGVATGAEVNQNTFSNVAVGSITIQADGKQDTLTIAQGANITITADATNDKLTVAVSGTVPNATNAATAVTCTGNSATATKWQTARKIGGVSVDGSADIDLPGVNKAGTQDTSGSATKHGGYTVAQLFDYFHPVGSIWETTTTDDPNVLWAGTTWVKMDAGRVLISAGSYTENGTTYTYNLGDKGGEAKHQITIEELPSHGHGASISSVDLVGTLEAYTWDPSASGIVSAQDMNGDVKTSGHHGYYRYTVNASHGHSVFISNTGGNNHHENRQPYTVVNRWKRTA